MQLRLAGAIFGVDTALLGNFDLSTARTFLFKPSSQLQELQTTLLAISNNNADTEVVGETAAEIAQKVAQKLATRGGISVQQLFPMLPSILQSARTNDSSTPPQPQPKQSFSAGVPGAGSGSPPSNSGTNDTSYSSTAMRVSEDVRGRSRSQELSSNGTVGGSSNGGKARFSSGAAAMERAMGNGELDSLPTTQPQNLKLDRLNGTEVVGDVPAPVVEIVDEGSRDEAALNVSRRTDGIRLIPL